MTIHVLKTSIHFAFRKFATTLIFRISFLGLVLLLKQEGHFLPLFVLRTLVKRKKKILKSRYAFLNLALLHEIILTSLLPNLMKMTITMRKALLQVVSFSYAFQTMPQPEITLQR